MRESRQITSVNSESLKNAISRRAGFAALAAAALAACPCAKVFAQAIDGTVSAGEYPILVDAQTNPTQFGDQGSMANPNSGSELDAMYAKLYSDGSYQLALTGDMENNGNGLAIMVQNQFSGGAVVGTTTGPGSSSYGVLGQITGSFTYAFGTYYSNPGSVVSPNFNPNQAYGFNNFSGTMYLDAHDMNQVPGTGPTGQTINPGPDYYMQNAGVGTNGTQMGGTPAVPSGPQTYGGTPISFGNGTLNFAYDNGNTAGVTDMVAATPGSNATGDPLTATTGLEVDLSSLLMNADPTEPIRILAYITGSGGGEYLSNQFLPSLSSAWSATNPGASGGGSTPDFDARALYDNPLTAYETLPFMSYNTNSSGNFSDSTNWEWGTVPGGTNVTAQFSGAPVSQKGGAQSAVSPTITNVTLDTPVTLGGIIFSASHSFNLIGSNTLTFGTYGRESFVGGVDEGFNAIYARVNNASGNNTIATPVQFASTGANGALDVTTAASTSLTFSGQWGPATTYTGFGLIKDGPGNLNMQNATSAFITVNQGTMALTPGTGSVGTSVVGAPGTGGTVTLAGGATLDLGEHGIINYYESNPTPVSTITGYVAAGVDRDGSGFPQWDQPGLTSTYAQQDYQNQQATGVGVMDNQDYLNTDGVSYNTSTFMGVPVSSDNVVLVRYTYYGDTNLDGVVDGTDVTDLQAGFAGGTQGDNWFFGDFNYDGNIDSTDVTLLILGFEAQGSEPVEMDAAMRLALEKDPITAAQALWLLSLEKGLTPAQIAKFESLVGVPEPTSIAMAGAALAGLLSRRRRRA